jgi:hypothetical protein
VRFSPELAAVARGAPQPRGPPGPSHGFAGVSAIAADGLATASIPPIVKADQAQQRADQIHVATTRVIIIMSDRGQLSEPFVRNPTELQWFYSRNQSRSADSVPSLFLTCLPCPNTAGAASVGLLRGMQRAMLSRFAILPASAYVLFITGNCQRASVAERPVVLPPEHRNGSNTC